MRQILEIRADQDQHDYVRSTALSGLIKVAGLTRRALVVLSRNLDAEQPFLDPLNALPPAHLEKAADRLRCTPQSLEAEIAEWSKALGWNLLEGLKSSRADLVQQES